MDFSLFKRKFKKLVGSGQGRRIRNICLTPDCDKQVAIIYSTTPFFAGFEHPLPNERNIIAIVGSFVEKGYNVDVYDYNWQGKIDKQYDVLFGLGGAFEWLSSDHDNQKALKILYLTEMPSNYSISIEKERKRIVQNKLGSSALETRSSKYYSERMFSLADSIIAIGSDFQQKQIMKLTDVPVYMIKPTIIPNLCSLDEIHESRNNKEFCWIGSSGALLKGLDTLIEAFNELPDYTLKLFGLKGKDKIFRKLISGSNIIDCGFLSVRSESFRREVMSCSGVISPSFSEGISTGVLTGMAMGCYPIVTPESGIALNNSYGRYLKGRSPSDFLEAILDLNNCEKDRILRKELAAMVAKDYSIPTYRKSLVETLEKQGV